MLRLQNALPDALHVRLTRRAGRPDPGGQGVARLPAGHPRPPLPAGRGDGLGRCPGRLLRPVPHRRRPDRGRVRRLLRCPLHGRVGRHPDRRPPAGASSPTSTPGAPWPTWPTSTRSRRRGRPWPPSPTSTGWCPVTYMNSSAALKAFVGRHGGVVCTSSNARAVLTWALGDDGDGHSRGDQVLFFPDQHLGRNTGFELGYGAEDMAVWNPRLTSGGLDDGDARSRRRLLLWKGHCSVHQRFRPSHVDAFRAEHPDGIVVVHPECAHDVVEVADQVGSTDFIIRAVAEAPAGSVIGVGTEIHLVKRLDDETPDKTVVSLDPLVCPCSTMFRIDAAHLAWVLEGLVDGEVAQPHRGRRRDGHLGQGGPGADAGHHLGRRHASRYRPSPRLGGGRDGLGGPHGRRPTADRADRTRIPDGTGPPRRRPPSPPPDGGAPRRRRPGRPGGRRAGVGGAGVVDRAGRPGRHHCPNRSPRCRCGPGPPTSPDIAVQRQVPTRAAPTRSCTDRCWPTWPGNGVGGPRLRRQGGGGRAARLLGDRADEVLHGPRKRLGPPWSKDHRLALAATVLAADRPGRGRTTRRRRPSWRRLPAAASWPPPASWPSPSWPPLLGHRRRRPSSPGPWRPLGRRCPLAGRLRGLAVDGGRHRRGGDAGQHAEHRGQHLAGVALPARRPPARGCPRPPPCRPASPPSGPMSMIQSALLITSRLCSMTMTVLPWSTSRLSTSSSLRTSSKCRPVVGSSST